MKRLVQLIFHILALEKKVTNMNGANPPGHFAWQTGKTAASIRFVNQATLYLQANYGTHNEQTDKVEKEIELIKNGNKVLTEFVEIEEFLAN